MKHIATIDIWDVEHKGIVYVVHRHEMWQEGEQLWFVRTADGRLVLAVLFAPHRASTEHQILVKK